MSIGHDLLNVPFPQMITKLGLSIAEAQFELDQTSMRIAQFMAGKIPGAIKAADPIAGPTDVEKDARVKEEEALKIDFPVAEKDKDGKVTYSTKSMTLLELGFTPTFYQFVDTIIEVKMSVSMRQSDETTHNQSEFKSKGGVSWALFSSGGAGYSLNTTSVSTSVANKYQYSAEGSSLIRTKLVPIPPPAILEDRIRNLINPPSPPKEAL